VLGLASATMAAPALADDIDLPADTGNPITGIAWTEATSAVLTVDDAGTIMAVDEASNASRPVTFTASTQSVQALSLFDDLLYIGDVGDADDSRDFITVFRVDPTSEATNYWAWDFSYPDGPQDAKAFAMSGRGRIYIVTDGNDPGIYRAELTPSRTAVNRLVRAADAPEGVTDAVFLDDGATLMLRSAAGVELIDAFSWESQAMTTYVEPQADESVTTYGPDRMLVGNSSTLRDEPLPSGTTTVTPDPAVQTTAAPSPSTSPDPGVEATVSAVPQEADPEENSRRGTALALLGAGVVAVLAGAVVFFVRD
ncbi:MAG: hypothetical protein ACTHU1_13180, partial [Arachnia sp.]